MAARKGQGGKGGKQPARKRPVPQVTPPESSSDEESWPVWQQLHDKIAALEAKRARQAEQVQQTPPRRSIRETKSQRRAKLKAMADNLLSRFAALEAEQHGGDSSTREQEGPSSSACSRSSSKGRRPRAVEASGSTSGPLGTSVTIEDASSEQTGLEEDTAGDAHPAGELPGTSVTTQATAAWPWPGFGQTQYTPYTPHDNQGLGIPSMQWPPVSPWPVTSMPCSGWAMPCHQASPQVPLATTPGVGVWPYPSVPDTGYNTVPLRALPYGDYTMPLGDHLTPATREKIWKGEYVDFFDLLNREVERKDVEREDEKDKEQRRRKKTERNWANWLPGFLIYAGVIVKAQPWRAQSLFQYLDIIYRAYVDFTGLAWLNYDQAFRMRSAIQPNLRWDEPLPGLWLQHMTPARPNLGDRFDSGHLNKKSVVAQTTRVTAGQAVQPRLLCWEYNAKGNCGRKPCRFRHECSACGGQHPYMSCFRTAAQRQNRGAGGGKKPNTGGGSAGKGPQPN